jgi:DnaJ-class molecular chaperone
MNIDLNVSIYEVCSECRGTGRIRNRYDMGMFDQCISCNEEGKILNKLGQEILELIEMKMKENKS